MFEVLCLFKVKSSIKNIKPYYFESVKVDNLYLAVGIIDNFCFIFMLFSIFLEFSTVINIILVRLAISVEEIYLV